jgi:hypothetical protein
MADEHAASRQPPDSSGSEKPAAKRSEGGRGQHATGTGARLALGAVRLIALVGVVALAVICGAILAGQDVDGWIIGLAIGIGVQVLTVVVLFSRRFAPRE